MLLQLLICLSWLTLTSAAATGCQEKCGDFNIPYPFGIGEQNCYKPGLDFLVCNESFSPPRLLYGNIPVVDISLDGAMTVNLGVSYHCYDKFGVTNYSEWGTTLSSLFTFSDTRNKFTAIGCDTNAIMSDSSVAIFKSGCMSVCANERSVVEGSCSGIGCCQTAIPKGLKTLNVSLSSFYSHNYSWAYNPCSYAFFADSEQFNFSRSDLLSFTGMGPEINNDISFPAVLDWVVGLETCEEAKRNLTSYACKDNSGCVDSTNGPGYRCRCNPGYEGNPYFANGCQDVDECNDPIANDCVKICKNTLGSFNCSCQEGYHGDGRRVVDGSHWTGCTKNNFPIMKTTLGVGSGFLFLLVGISWLYFCTQKRKLIQLKEKLFQQNGGYILKLRISSQEGGFESSKIFSAEELKRATNNYDQSRILGRGGYGIVYKGILADNTVVAIKKSKIADETQIEQFINEILILTRVNHRNVVKLFGCCLETEVPLLVYEYVSNGNLFQHIHGDSFISWEDRLRIAAETAGAIAYLHSASSTPVIHRDVKSSNILLDGSLIAKVADFGASRLVPLDRTHVSTLVQGTLGYLDPEYFHSSQLTEKSDVYSFGVVLVELLTGKKPLCPERSQDDRNLATYFITLLKENRFFQLLESQIMNDGKERVVACTELAKRCLNLRGEERPTMKEVAMELEGLRRFERHPWELQKNEERTSLISESQDLYSVELTSYTGNASGQYSMGIMSMSIPPR